MSELAHRQQVEADFAILMSRLGTKHRAELIGLLGSPPDPMRVPPEFWKKVEDETAAQLAVILALIFMDSAKQHAYELLTPELRTVALEPAGAIQVKAHTWADTHAADVAKGFADRSKDMLDARGVDWQAKAAGGREFSGDILRPYPTWLKPGEPGEIPQHALDDLLEIFGPSRSENLAVTETTQGTTAGTGAIIHEANEAGIKTSVVWRTEKDGAVCPVCFPLEGQHMGNWHGALIAVPNFPEVVIDKIMEQGGPPLHPRCRCWLEVTVLESDVTNPE